MKSTAPGSILYHICFEIYFYSILFLDLLFQKPKNTLLHLLFAYFISRFIEIYLFNLPQILSSQLDNFWRCYPKKGLTTPYTCRVASICSLCVGTVYIVFLGPPTGLIPWFSKTEGNTYATLLQHPFLFGENQCKLRRSTR